MNAETEMNVSDYLIIFGAPDPERVEAEDVCRRHGVPYTYATRDGEPVHPGNAYRADGTNRLIPENSVIVLFECAVKGVGGIVIDHHRPGDPGYGRPPKEFWRASSLGQLCNLIGKRPTPHELIVAAADHCLRAAYAGDCPGVRPDDLARWRIASRARYQGRSADAVRADVEAAIAILGNARSIDIDGTTSLADMRDQQVPELPEAAVRCGRSYMAGPLRDRDGRVKYTVSGSSDEVRAWMVIAGDMWDLVDIYGDPDRGFAGGYSNECK